MSNKQKAIAILESLVTGDTSAVEQYVSDDTYIQHNLSAPSGKANFLGLMSMLGNDNKVNIARVLEDGDIVAVHTQYYLPMFGGDLIGFDVFRFEDGLVVEHWDNLQPVATETASGRSQIDGPTDISDLDKTEANKTFAAGFIKDILMAENMGKITEYISTEKYHQHNPAVGDGLAAFGAAAQSMAEAGTPMVYTDNHMLIVEGDFALALSEGQFLGKHSAFFDLIRIEDGLITEHWDVVQEIPAKEDWKNDNGKF